MTVKSLLDEFSPQIHARLEKLLRDDGFPPDVMGYLTESSRLRRKIRSLPDQNWSSPESFALNLNDLRAWATKYLSEKRGIQPDLPRNRPSTTQFASTSGALGYLIAADPEVRAEVLKIRQQFFGSDEPPFFIRTLGEREALRQACDWLEAHQVADAAGRSHRKAYISISAVLEYDYHGPGSLDLHDQIHDVMLSWAVPQPDGTMLGGKVTGREFMQAMATIMPADGVMVTHRTLSGCGPDGKERPMLGLRGPDGWRKHWVVAYESSLYRLWKACDALSKLTRKWKNHEALEYVMTGIVPRLGADTTWTNAGDPYSDVTIQLRAPTTRRDFMQIYDGWTKHGHFQRPSARNLSAQLLAVLQVHHDYPQATWRERIAVLNGWAAHHKELRPYVGAAAQQSIRKDYQRAVERSAWMYDKRLSGQQADEPKFRE